MNKSKKLSAFTLACLISFHALVSFAFAQITITTNLFGDETQPGNRLHDEIVLLHENGEQNAIAIAIEESIQGESTMLGGEAKQAIAFDIPHANFFYVNMTEFNSLIEVTKRLIESKPEMAIHTITLAVVLYPDFAQEIYDGAALTGVLNNDDLLIAMLQAGADPSTFVDATAAGISTATGPVVATIPPLGSGIGAGGTGGGDTTASTN